MKYFRILFFSKSKSLITGIIGIGLLFTTALTIAASPPPPPEQPPSYFIVKIYREKAEDLTPLVNEGVDIRGPANEQRTAVFAKVLPEQLQLLKAQGYKFDIVKTSQEVTVQLVFGTGYHTYSSMRSELQSLASAYSNLLQLQDFGDSWEKTKGKADRDLWLVKITSPQGSNKPKVLFEGGQHARELAGPEITLKLINYLTTNYGSNPDVTYLLDNTEVWILPMVNPDGHAKAEANLDWRKNTNDSYMGKFANANWTPPYGPGVDLNRNYSFHWGEAGSSSKPPWPTYRGPSYFTEQESVAPKVVMGNQTFSFFMDYHSNGNCVIWPYDYTKSTTGISPLLPAVGKKLASYNGYAAGNLYSTMGYLASGTNTDWAYGVKNILSFTTEIGNSSDGFDPPYSRIEAFWNENRPGALYLLKLAGSPNLVYGPEITGITASPNPASAGTTVTVTAHASETNNGGQSIAFVEYFIDVIGLNGTGLAMFATDGSFNSPEEDLVATISTYGLTLGRHILYLHSRDSSGNWGTITAVFLDIQ